MASASRSRHEPVAHQPVHSGNAALDAPLFARVLITAGLRGRGTSALLYMLTCRSLLVCRAGCGVSVDRPQFRQDVQTRIVC